MPFHFCCRKQVAHKGFCIYTIPNTLILALKRFHHDPSESPKPRKLYGRIIYGQKLDLKDYLAQNSPDHPSHSNNVHKPSSAEMWLSGVVIHRGGIGEGHYWAYVQDTCKPGKVVSLVCIPGVLIVHMSADHSVLCSLFAKRQPALLLFLLVLCHAQVETEAVQKLLT